MNEVIGKPDGENVSVPSITKISLGLGFIAACPYLCIGFAYLYDYLFIDRKQPRMRKNMAFSLPSILLGMVGVIGHIWFFATCQFRQ